MNQILCETPMHFVAKSLSNAIELEARWLLDNNDRGLDVKDIIDLDYEVIKSAPIVITPTLEIIIAEPLELSFTSKVMFYCVFHHKQTGSVCIPGWFPMVMFGEPTGTYVISSKNVPNDSIAGIQIPEIMKSFNKFDMLVDE